MATVATWNYFNRNVQSGLLEGRFMSAAYTLVAAGSPRLAAVPGATAENVVLGDDIAWPMGVLQNVNLSQNAQIMRIWEIGSERSYFVRGRTVGQIGFGRAMYHGPSMLRAMYAYLSASGWNVAFDALYQNASRTVLNTSGNPGGKQDYALPPGFENMWLDLASDVFSQPIGELLMFRDSNEDTVGAIYLEYSYVTNHSLNTDAGGTLLTESVAVLYERMVPIDVQAVALIKDSTDVQSIVGSNVIGSAA